MEKPSIAAPRPQRAHVSRAHSVAPRRRSRKTSGGCRRPSGRPPAAPRGTDLQVRPVPRRCPIGRALIAATEASALPAAVRSPPPLDSARRIGACDLRQVRTTAAPVMKLRHADPRPRGRAASRAPRLARESNAVDASGRAANRCQRLRSRPALDVKSQDVIPVRGVAGPRSYAFDGSSVVCFRSSSQRSPDKVLPCLFRLAHHLGHWTEAASGGLNPNPAIRVRGACPHLSCSKAASERSMQKHKTLLRAVVAHSSRRTAPDRARLPTVAGSRCRRSHGPCSARQGLTEGAVFRPRKTGGVS